MVEQGRDSAVHYGPIAASGSSALRREAWPASDVLQNAILTSTRLPVVATDTSGIVRFFNVGAELMLGYSEGEILNRLPTMLAPDFQALAGNAARGLEDCYESTLIHKNRTRIAVAVSITALRDESHAILGYLYILRERSARKQPDVCDSDLLARMSHDMRTPLSAILGFAQLMASGTPAPTASQQRNLDLILHAGWELESLIKTTRDLTLLDSDPLALSLDTVALAAVMRDCQALIESQAQRRGVRLTFPLLDTQCFVLADALRLQQLLGSLLSVAIEGSPVDAAIVVECETRSQDWIRIDINETGAEVSTRQRTGDESTSLAGSGIRQLLAKRLVEAMGGTMGAESTVGTGTIFSFELKRMLVPMADRSASPRQESLDIAFKASESSAANTITE